MNTHEILAAIDAEIIKLQKARSILSSYADPVVIKRGPGRPKQLIVTAAKAVTKRVMSSEGKARIAAAQKKRWAAAKKAAKAAA
jgi:hypothetical protein